MTVAFVSVSECASHVLAGSCEMGDLGKKAVHDRSKINMHEPDEVKHWMHHLGTTKEELQKAIDKVGNSAAAVRKQLADKNQQSKINTSDARG